MTRLLNGCKNREGLSQAREHARRFAFSLKAHRERWNRRCGISDGPHGEGIGDSREFGPRQRRQSVLPDVVIAAEAHKGD